MNNIKLVYYDSSAMTQEQIEGTLSKLSITSFYSIRIGLILISSEYTSKELFELLMPKEIMFNLFIVDISIENGTYWGYMDKKLWEWLKLNAPGGNN